MTTFKLLRGNHKEPNANGGLVSYRKGDLVSSEKDLEALFGSEKFRHILPGDVPSPMKTKVAAKPVPEPTPEPEIEEEEEEISSATLSVSIVRRGSRYDIVRDDTGEKINEKGLTKVKADEFLQALGEVTVSEDARD